MKRFLRGVFNLRPSLPRYTLTWDVKEVLNFIRNIDSISCNLKLLTLKLTMLIALLSGQRVQTLQAIKVSNIHCNGNLLTIFIDTLLKQSKPGKHLKALTFKQYTMDKSLCIVSSMSEYLSRTSHIRSDQNELLLSYIKPHKPVSAETIARWLKHVLQESGVDINTFSAHSTRAASSSAVYSSGVPIDSIMEMVGWSSVKTFATFYNKATDSTPPTFGQHLLSASNNQSQ